MSINSKLSKIQGREAVPAISFWKSSRLVLFLVLLSMASARADIVAQWTFNSPAPDGDAKTGSRIPSTGNGLSSYVGGAGPASSGEFVAGNTRLDPAGAADNSAWNTSKYPPAASANKSAGVEFDVPTTDYENIVLSWSQQNSGSASRYARLQYTLDGSAFNDADVIALYAASVFTNQSVDLSAIAGAADNPRFGFRLVTEFESTATGSGTNAYVPTSGSSYTTSGTIRFDMVTISGALRAGANTPPHLSTLTNLTLRVYQSSEPLRVLVWDLEDAPEKLTLDKASSDPAVLPSANIILAGAGGQRTVTILAAGQPGLSVITLSVIDSGGKSNSTTFTVQVLPENTPPFISSVGPTNTLLNTPAGPIAFNVGDLETPADSLAVSARSANPLLVPNTPANINLGGSGSDRTVILTPASGQSGVAPITLTVSDGANTTSSAFSLLVRPSPAVLLEEPFDYPNGSLLSNSAGLWDNRSGTYGQCQVTNGQLQITGAQTEDVIARLAGAPYAKGYGTILYASFKVKFLALPKPAPGYFAHFADGSMLRGRIFASTTNSWPGGFRLLVANGLDHATNQFFAVLSPDWTYTVVTRYAIDTAITTLWVDPKAESDTAVSGADPQTATPIASFGFRQDSDLGATILIDDLRVGASFAAVTAAAPIAEPLALSIERGGAGVILRWANPAATLECAPAALGPYSGVPGATSPFTNMAQGTGFFRLALPVSLAAEDFHGSNLQNDD